MSIGRWKQWAFEKAGSVQPTQLDEDFADLARKTDSINDTIKNLINATESLLQPSSSTRAKLRTQHKGSSTGQLPYVQPEGALSEAMQKGIAAYGDSPFGRSLQVMGDAEKEIAEARYMLDTEVMQSVVKPLTDFREHDIKGVNAHRKKLESRRLDYDVKKRGLARKPDDVKALADFVDAEANFESCKEQTWNGMARLIEQEPEQCQQVLALAQAQIEFYKAAIATLKPIVGQLQEHCKEAGARPPLPRYERKLSSSGAVISASTSVGGAAPKTVRALFDFNAENEQELSFKQNDVIEVLQVLDDNWMEGSVNGKAGIFPRAYVEN